MDRKVLVVDDELLTRELLRLMLEPAGFQVVEASSGLEALEKVADVLPDIVLLDIMMPDISGLAVCERLRADDRTAALPIIMLSVRTGLKDVQAGLDAGANKYLLKPISREELISAIHQHII